MKKIDFKRELKHLYKPSSKEVQILDVPKMNYLLIHGKGEPGGKEYTDAVQTLYPVAYTLKFTIKKNKDMDYGVLPLEGLWWAEDMENFSRDTWSEWLWTLMIMQPDFITKKQVQEAIEEVRVKKNPAAIDKIQFESFSEGKCAQIMHLVLQPENIFTLFEWHGGPGPVIAVRDCRRHGCRR